MNFTNNEKLYIIAALRLVMEADTVIHPLENEYMNKVLNELNVTSDLLEKYICYDVSQCSQFLKTLPNESKDYVCNLLHNMASADGFVDSREIALIDKLFV